MQYFYFVYIFLQTLQVQLPGNQVTNQLQKTEGLRYKFIQLILEILDHDNLKILEKEN